MASVTTEAHTTPAPPARPAAKRLGLVDLRRSFGSKPVLRGINLEVAAGEFVAVVGRSGGGKTTLLRLISGLDAPTTGQVLVDGGAVKGVNADVRVLFQEARLLPWLSVADNVALGPQRAAAGTVNAMIAQVGLAGREKDWPSVLSGGQRQRVALARGLASDPAILLLDEPLCSLDALTRIEMQELIEALWCRRGFTAVLITHDVEEAVALADRVLVLESGQFPMEVAVPLPRPRRRESPEFGRLVRRLLERLLHRSRPDIPAR